MGRPTNTAVRREQIVRGLLEIMAMEGYEGASVTRIAEAAGLAPGLVHYHFRDKRAILVALIAYLEGLAAVRAEERMARAGDDPYRRLDAFIDAHLALGPVADPAAVACWVAIGAEAVRHPEVGVAYRAAVAASIEQLDPLVRAALKTARGNARGSRAIAAAVLAAIHGCFLLHAAAPGTLPAGASATSVKRMARGLVETR